VQLTSTNSSIGLIYALKRIFMNNYLLLYYLFLTKIDFGSG